VGQVAHNFIEFSKLINNFWRDSYGGKDKMLFFTRFFLFNIVLLRILKQIHLPELLRNNSCIPLLGDDHIVGLI